MKGSHHSGCTWAQFLPSNCEERDNIYVAYSDRQDAARRRRNRGITLMLIGVILLFIVCHVGEIFMSLYEMFYPLHNDENKRYAFLLRVTALRWQQGSSICPFSPVAFPSGPRT